MATSTQTKTGFGVNPRIVFKMVVAGVLAAIGSVLVLIGLTDFLAYLDGYRPGGPAIQLYTNAFIVLTIGWMALIASLIVTGRTVLADT